MPAKRVKERRGPWRSGAYRAWIRTHPCIGITEKIPHECDAWRGIEASHTGEDKGAGTKASDKSCMPKCGQLHWEWERRRGAFEGWSRQRRATWAEPITSRFYASWVEMNTRRAA